jgi:hypothetical protein
MPITDLPFAIPYPPYRAATATLTTRQIFSASGVAATIFQIARTGNVRRIHFATGTVTTGATILVRLETVDLSTGNPSGTLVGTNTEDAAFVIANGDDSVFLTATLTADAAVTVGDYVAVVLQNPASSHGSMNFAAHASSEFNVPYGFDNGNKSNNLLMLALEYDDGTVTPIPGIRSPATAQTSVTFSNASTPDVYGTLFTPTLELRVAGAWVNIDQDADCHVRLVSTAYNQGAGTGILAGVTLDTNVRRDGASSQALVQFPAPVDLVAGTAYRLIVEPNSGSSIQFHYYNTGSQLGLDAVGFGCLTTAKDPTSNGDWTDHNSGTFRWALMGLVVSGVAGGAAASGGPLMRSRLLG